MDEVKFVSSISQPDWDRAMRGGLSAALSLGENVQTKALARSNLEVMSTSEVNSALSNKVSINLGTISDTLNNAVLPGRWTVAVPSDAPGNPIQYPGGVLFGFLDVYAQSTWLMQVFSPAGTGEDAGYMYIRKNISNTGWTDWYRFATATLPNGYNLPLTDGISVQAGLSAVYSKNQFGQVIVFGSLSGQMPNGAVVATLPSGFRPIFTFEMPATCDFDAGRIQVNSLGEIRVISKLSECSSFSFLAVFVTEK